MQTRVCAHTRVRAHTHTHTLTHTHTPTHLHSLVFLLHEERQLHIHTCNFDFAHTLSLCLSRSLSRSLSLFPFSLSVSLSLPSRSLARSLARSLPYTHTQINTHTSAQSLVPASRRGAAANQRQQFRLLSADTTGLCRLGAGSARCQATCSRRRCRRWQ